MASVSVTVTFIAVSYLLVIPVTADSLQEVLFNGNYEFVDLSHTFNNNTVYWPGGKKFQFTKKRVLYNSDNTFLYASNDFEAAEHGGTHLDAPYHFLTSGKYVDELSLERLIVPLIIVDVSSKVNGDPDFVLYENDMDLTINKNFGKPTLIVFKFGWSQYFNDEHKYLGLDGTKLRFPGLSTEVAEWIVSYKNIVGVGVDVPSVDTGAATDFPVHKIFAKAGLYNIEHVNLHKNISEYKCTAIALPMKIGSGTGAPLRLVAVCPKEA